MPGKKRQRTMETGEDVHKVLKIKQSSFFYSVSGGGKLPWLMRSYL